MNFRDNVLSRCHKNKWPARSPDLTPVDLKRRVYENGQLKTKKELSAKIISAAKAITLGSVKSANVSFLKRISHVLSQNSYACLLLINV